MSYRHCSVAALAFALLLSGYGHRESPAAPANRVTILYDAFGKSPEMRKDWGYSALVEYGGKRILFDTGNNPEIFAQNVKAAGVDLMKLDFVVVSHRHLDHTAGLTHLLSVNPKVKIYVPKDGFGVFGSSLPSTFYRRQDSLPGEMRYFDGHPADTLTFGTAWLEGKFVLVDAPREVAPGVHLISLVSETVGTKELRELSLAIETPQGMIVVAGCSHPGIERIVEAAKAIRQDVHMVFGGFHPACRDRPGHRAHCSRAPRHLRRESHRARALHRGAGILSVQAHLEGSVQVRRRGQRHRSAVR